MPRAGRFEVVTWRAEIQILIYVQFKNKNVPRPPTAHTRQCVYRKPTICRSRFPFAKQLHDATLSLSMDKVSDRLASNEKEWSQG